ncbi:MAG: BamA/TamA family outer membrane protein [Polyangia bacterium]
MRRLSLPSVVVLTCCALTIRAGSTWAQAAASAKPPQEGRKVEFGLVPLVGGDTDVGLGFGVLSTVAGVAPDAKPYRWAVETAGFISFKRDQGEFITPYQDYSVQWTAPQLLNKRLRIEVRPSYTKETTQRFYGLGNASPAPEGDMAARDFYGRTHPTLWVRLRYRVWDHLHLGVGSSYTQNWLDIGSSSTLAQQMATGTPAQRDLLGVAGRHGVLILEGTALYDTRDSETVPEQGQMHQIRLRISPAIGSEAMPYSYQQLDVSTRLYYTVIPDRLVLAARAVADMQFGHPPFYELARYEDTFALGGQNGVRGVPGQRYYGKIKIFTNFEVRSQLLKFKLFGKDSTLGAALFFDVGRLWADWGSHPELDGRGWGLKYGTGGGLRLQQGKTFVVRADLAWSPDARPVGGYVGAGQMF